MIREDEDVNHASVDVLRRRLEEVFRAAPELTPDRRMHDYQLTYPPAIQLETPEFRGAPSEERYRAEAIGAHRDVGFYFHFGFCRYRCRYCFHYELTTRTSEERIARYVRALLSEARRMRELAPELRHCLSFLGGGTPTALPEASIEDFCDGYVALFGEAPSRLSTVEAKPITATRATLEPYLEAGFRRVNFGVQTFDPELYAFHHHGEDVRVVHDAIALARDLGFEWINVDLMTGLERQTPAHSARTQQDVLRLIDAGAIDSVFLYPYHDDPRSRIYRADDRVPDVFEVFHSEASLRGALETRGWTELGPRFFRSPSHVACEGVEVARLGVVPAYGETAYLGFGNSAFSVGDRASYLNERSVDAYCDRIEGGELAIAHYATLDDAQRAARDVSFALLYAPFCDWGRLSDKYGAPLLAPHVAKMKRWAELGLGRFDRLFRLFALNRLGKLVHQQMLPSIYLAPDRERFDAVRIRRRDAGSAYRGY